MSDETPPQKITYLGKVDYRNKSLTFGIKENDRTRHMYVIGKTGMGKSTLLQNMVIQDIQNGEGVCVIDPHGSLAEAILDYIPKERIEDVIYFAPFDSEYPVGLNVLEKVDITKRHLVANGLMSAFKKIFGEERFSDRIQYILNNIILSLLENENESLLGVNRMLNDKDYRKFIISNVKDPSVRSFWLEEYAKAGDKYQQEAAPGIQNKIGQFISNPLIRNIIGQKRTSFDIREVMDKKKILIVNLSKGKVGEGNANLIGSLLITKIYLAAMSRADVGVHELEKLPPFYLYVDEFQNFANESFANILSEARKYNLALTVAHQYVEQMTDEVKAAVFGNVGSMICFRVGATDAELFEKEFAPYFVLDDIVNLGFTQVYLRLMIDGVGSKPFSAQTLGPIKRPASSFISEIIEHSRNTYGKKLPDAEEEIRSWYEPKMQEKGEVSAQTGSQGEGKKEVKVVQEKREERRDGKQSQYQKRYTDNAQRPPKVEEKRQERDYQQKDDRREERHDVSSRSQDTHHSTTQREEVLTSHHDEQAKEFEKRQSENRREQKGDMPEEKTHSLKEALQKALEERDKEEQVEKKVITSNFLDDAMKTEPLPEKKEVKEISEDILRPLVINDTLT